MYILLLSKMDDVILKGVNISSEYQELIEDLENEIEAQS